MSLLPEASGLQFQQRTDGHWLIASGNRHVVAGRETLRVVQAIAASDTYETAYGRYRDDGGQLTFDAFLEHAEKCRNALGSFDARRDTAVKWRLRLFGPALANRLAAALSLLFRWPGAIFGLAAALVAIGFVVASLRWSEAVTCSIASIDIVQMLGAFALVMIGIVFHEIGHAAALASRGQPSGAIGFGLYAGILPVFYTDLSRSWRLPVRGRIVVSLGGVYAQLIYSALLIGASMPWKSDFLMAAGLGSAVLALFQLIPVARSDGFWILSDLLDEPKLGHYERGLWAVWKHGAPAIRNAKTRLAYLAANTVFVAALLLYTSVRARDFAVDLLHYLRTGIGSDALDSPAMYLSFLIFCLLLFRMLGGIFKRLFAAPSKTRTA
jgi:Zn-dependent protease